MRKKQSPWTCLAIIGVLILSCGILVGSLGQYLDSLCKVDEVLAELSAGKDRTITISARTCWEVGRPLFYEVKDKGVVVIEKYFFDNDNGNDPHSYSLIFAQNKDLVGVLDLANRPYRDHLIIMYEFSSHGSWPRSGFGWSLFDALQQENPQLVRPPYFNHPTKEPSPVPKGTPDKTPLNLVF